MMTLTGLVGIFNVCT